MSTGKRSTTASAVPKPPISFAPTTCVSDSASLIGTKLITIRSNTIIHPRAKLITSHAPVTIGEACIVSERSAIGLQSASNEQPEGVNIGDYVIIDVGAVVEAKIVGEGSIIDVKSRVGKGAIIGKHCKIGPLCTVDENEILPDHTIIYGEGIRRIDHSGVENLKIRSIGRQVDVLKNLIPNNPAKFQ